MTPASATVDGQTLRDVSETCWRARARSSVIQSFVALPYSTMAEPCDDNASKITGISNASHSACEIIHHAAEESSAFGIRWLHTCLSPGSNQLARMP